MNVARALVLAGGMVGLGFAAPTSASILDQSFVTTDAPDHNTALGIAATSLAQSFTVGVTGTLAAVGFNVLRASASTTSDLTVDIRRLGADGAPVPDANNALATAAVSKDAIGVVSGLTQLTWTSILVDFSTANVAVTAGDTLAFVLTSPYSWSSAEYFLVQTDYDNGYSEGMRWHRSVSSNAFESLPSADLPFKTYVDVPEPASVALLALGLAGLGLIRRKVA